jgi:uncharacterized glyoxalase superfamily protein PhnB
MRHGFEESNMKNRSVPSESMIAHVVYRDVEEAIAWLTKVFGFTENYRYGEPAGGAQMLFGSAVMMIQRARPGRLIPKEVGGETQSLTLFVDNVGAHYERSRNAGAKITEELNETTYGELQYGVEDLAGHHWLFSQHARDVSPEEWGARVARS